MDDILESGTSGDDILGCRISRDDILENMTSKDDRTSRDAVGISGMVSYSEGHPVMMYCTSRNDVLKCRTSRYVSIGN